MIENDYPNCAVTRYPNDVFKIKNIIHSFNINTISITDASGIKRNIVDFVEIILRFACPHTF